MQLLTAAIRAYRKKEGEIAVSIEITIRLNSILKRHSEDPAGKVIMTIDEGTRIGQVLEKIPIVKGEAGTIILNSKLVQEDAVLRDGDVVELYPVMGGG